jgi:hypothetical protein
MGPALGINLAEFEFPAYFNYFVRGKRCSLVVDTPDAEYDIRQVFSETLLGPEYFRNHQHPCANVDEDFDPSFPKDARPNFYKEFYNFRTAEESTNNSELTIDTLLDFVHFRPCRQSDQLQADKLGIPPTSLEFEVESMGSQTSFRASETHGLERFASAGSQRRGHRRNTLSGGSEDEMFNSFSNDTPGKVTFGGEFISPGLQRRNSDSSASQRSHSTQASRRNSMGSVDGGSVDDAYRTTSVQVGASPETRRSSMPYSDHRRSSLPSGYSVPANEAPFLDERDSLVSVEGRRDSLLSVNSEMTSMTGPSRVSNSKSSRMSVTSASMYPYDFMTDDGADLQESSWMYSQAKWLGKSFVMLRFRFLSPKRRPRIRLSLILMSTLVHNFR